MPQPPDVPSPPALALARRQATIAGISAAGCALSLACGLGYLAPIFGATTIVFVAFAWLSGSNAWGSALSHAALQEITRGRFENVAALHARIPARSLRRGTVARAIAHQRALLAMYRSAPDEAIEALGPAVDPSTSVLMRTHERVQIAAALALRAFAHAARGDLERAEADAARAEAMPEATGETLARAELARAVVLARRGPMEELARHLSRSASLMLESSLPRERVLVRALRRLSRSRARSVYRESAKPADEAEAGRVGDWISRIAPEAAAHARGDAFADRLERDAAPDASPSAFAAIAAERQRVVGGARSVRWRAAAVSLGVLATIGALFATAARGMFAITASTDASPDLVPQALGFVGGAFLLTGMFAATAVQLARARRLNAPHLAANRALAKGDDAEVERLAARLTKSASPLFVAAGHAALATLAERRADFVAAKDATTRALAVVGTGAAMKAAAAPQLLPSLLAVRAVSLAALGRADEARAELAALLSAHGTWSHAAATELRVRVLAAVTSGDLDAARAAARERTAELPLPLRDDVLADLVLAVGPDGFSSEERERLAAELDDDARLRVWIDAVAPGLRDRFAAAAPRARVAEQVDARELDDDEVAEPAAARTQVVR